MTSKYVATGVAGPAYRIESKGGHGITDLDRAQPRQAIPLDALEPLFDAWNDGIERAKRAYYGKTYLDRRIARSEANQRWRAKKKGQQQ